MPAAENPVVKFIGPKYIDMARSWRRTGLIWGGFLGVGVLYMTDWSVVLKYVPVINWKYTKTEDS